MAGTGEIIGIKNSFVSPNLSSSFSHDKFYHYSHIFVTANAFNKGNTCTLKFAVKLFTTVLTFNRDIQYTYIYVTAFNDPEKKAFENKMGIGKHAGNQHFLLFPQ